MANVGFSVPGHTQISDTAGLEIVKREAVTTLLSNCISAGLVHTPEDLQKWAAAVKNAYVTSTS